MLFKGFRRVSKGFKSFEVSLRVLRVFKVFGLQKKIFLVLGVQSRDTVLGFGLSGFRVLVLLGALGRGA